VPTQAAILTGVMADLNSAFNGNLNPALNTPQGQLATSLAAMVAQCYGAIAYFVNNINPASAQSFLQDAIGFLYYLTRNPGTPTTVQCQCVGASGTSIPVGALAIDTSGNQYTCTEAGVIPGGGSITLSFANQVNGPIPCPANTLTTIYQAISGWNTINNSSAGILGANVESAPAFAARIEASVASNAQGSLPSLYGALAALPGVTAVYCVQNDTSAAVLTGPTSYSIPANSIYAAVVGGTAAQIGTAIFTKKSPGCGTVGNQSVVVYDTSYPVGSQPAYTEKYNIPNSIPVTFAVTLGAAPPLPGNIASLVQSAIVAQFQNGSTTVPAVGIASTILAANYFAPVLAVYPGVPLLTITLGTAFVGAGSVASSTTLTISSVTSGFLNAGDTVMGTDIPVSPSTYIVQQLTGTPGGIGTYQMSASATGSASITVTSTAGGLTTWSAGIDQYPTITSANITVIVL
jgi:uncharacterized phage protein gp47/JayE